MPLIFRPSVIRTSLGVQNLLRLCELFIFFQFVYVSSSVGASLTWESSRHFGDATSGWPAKRTQKLHTDDVSLPRPGWCFWLVDANFLRSTINQKHHPNLGSDVISMEFLRSFHRRRPLEGSSNDARCRLFSQASSSCQVLNFMQLFRVV